MAKQNVLDGMNKSLKDLGVSSVCVMDDYGWDSG